jgi:hypothetical protein
MPVTSTNVAYVNFQRPGDVKDFVKKIKLEDTRIEMRREAFARQAERVAAARAKAAAVGTPTSTPGSHEAAVDPNKSSASAASGGLHPSLPAKPGSSSPSKESEPSQAQPTPTPTSPKPAPAPTERVPTPTPAAAAPAPVTTAPAADEHILKLEEVTCFTFVPTKKKRTCDLKLCCSCRTSSAGHGSRCAVPATSTSRCSQRSAWATSWRWRGRSSASARRGRMRRRRSAERVR